ncbi:Hypothetical predicted protein [Scomber scombrus]|uniref:Uncharacterized protein n=1 Tax=Scomber scombrus TaxID=13677 RepID=A0AAV1PR86_SCOSC
MLDPCLRQLSERERDACVDPKWRQFHSARKRYPPTAAQPIEALVSFPECFRPERPHTGVKGRSKTARMVYSEPTATNGNIQHRPKILWQRINIKDSDNYLILVDIQTEDSVDSRAAGVFLVGFKPTDILPQPWNRLNAPLVL